MQRIEESKIFFRSKLTMIAKGIEGWLAFLFLLSSMGCQGDSGARNDPLVEAWGRPLITIEEYRNAFEDQYRKWSSHGESPPVDSENLFRLKLAFLDRLIEEKLLLDRAKELKIGVSRDEIEARVASIQKDNPEASKQGMSMTGPFDPVRLREEIQRELLMRKVVERSLGQKVTVEPREVKDYFEIKKEGYRLPKQVRASQIVVATDSEARKLLRQLKGGADFAKLAKKHSLSPDGQNGGDLGFFSPGQMPREFDEVVFSLQPGQLSRVVESPYGYHLFIVRERRGERRLTFREVEARIKDEIHKDKEERLYREWLDGLKNEARIKMHSERLRSRPMKEKG